MGLFNKIRLAYQRGRLIRQQEAEENIVKEKYGDIMLEYGILALSYDRRGDKEQYSNYANLFSINKDKKERELREIQDKYKCLFAKLR